MGERVARIAPSILNADFGRLAEEVQAVEAGGADWIHLDVMDGRFVPNISLGIPVVEAVRRSTRLPLEIHLMIEEPARYLEQFREAGGDWLTIHLEADRHAHRTLARAREIGAKAGLALNPGTPVAHAADLVDGLDLLLVMSVNPGFGGQAFVPLTLDKLREARALVEARNPTCLVEVDGGINLANACAAFEAGADVLVAGSFVYRGGVGPADNLRALRAAVTRKTPALGRGQGVG